MDRHILALGILLVFLSVCSAQSKRSLQQFSVVDIDGAIHILRTADGPYRSFDEFPDEVKERILRAKKISLDQKLSLDNSIHSSITFVVSDPSDAADSDIDDGLYSPPTLRSAIQNANLYSGATHFITFSPGITIIKPSTQLPSVNVGVIINGTVAAGNVVLDGSLSTGTFGLSLAKPSTVKFMTFKSWKTVGLGLSSEATSSEILNCNFTLNKTGLNINSNVTFVGGESLDFINYAHGNTQDGIAIVFADFCTIHNNFSGTFDGFTPSPNTSTGLYVLGENNRVISNTLSGNDDGGLEIGEFSKNTLVWKNNIGVDFLGLARLPNSGDGITTFADKDSIIDNVITGNGYGITVLGQSSQSYIGNNVIGLNQTMDSLIGNRFSGIQVLGEKTIIENNIISANKGDGISITGLGSAIVRRNYIGVDENGTKDWGNAGNGIYISCNNNIIGGEFPADKNIISGNGGSGIELYGGIIFSFPGPSGPNYVVNNLIQYNHIGTSKSGSLKIPNDDGITLWGYADSNSIYSNLVSGNNRYGIRFRPANGVPSHNYVSSNYIGTNINGVIALPNAEAGVHFLAGFNNTIGGPTNQYANVISGNNGPGIFFEGGAENIVSRNFIGVTTEGTFGLPNTWAGVRITSASNQNVITSNLISGNSGYGVSVESRSGKIPYNNIIINNVIGLKYNSNTALPNSDAGVNIYNAQNTWIGGSTFDSSNVISGNLGPGIQMYGDTARYNSVWGNYIGTNEAGTAAIPNERGIVLNQTSLNKIGGEIVGSGNLISGNSGEGIYLYYADSNIVSANIIGLSLDQTTKIPNQYSGIVIDSSRYNTIGSGPAGIGNTISGNTLSGIEIKNYSRGNRIFNNNIGTDHTGTQKLGNTLDGIQVYGGSSGNTIGALGAGNRIRFNTLAGIIIADSTRNRISWNSFEGNGELGIDLLENGQFGVTKNDDQDTDTGANELQNFPELFFADGPSPVRVSGVLRGTPKMSHVIEFFEADATDSTKYGEGKRYLGNVTVTTDSFGFAILNTSLPATVPTGKYITATATDFANNTSEFSRCVPVLASDVFADIAVSVYAMKDTVNKGDTLVYHINVTNNGPDSATSIVLKDTLSKRVLYLADSTSKGIRSFAAGILTVAIPAMNPGESVSIILSVRADSAGMVMNTAHASALQSDFNPANNAGRDTVFVSTPLAVTSTAALPISYELYQNFPNPFNPSTMFRFDLPAVGLVTLQIYDLLGREIRTLINEVKEPGRYSLEWSGANVSSGVYFYRLSSGDFTMTKKFILQK
jgi:uncharacterized repeat protein (TIGR01451 family)